MKAKNAAIMVMMTMVFSVTACHAGSEKNSAGGGKAKQEQNPLTENQKEDGRTNTETENQKDNGKTDTDTNEFSVKADLEGSVYDFDENAFFLSPAETHKDGEGSVMIQGSPGAEDESKLVEVSYAKDCMIQIVVMDAATLEEISREDTTSESIKKQTQVRVYGNCQDTNHWKAEKIVIVRWHE